MSNFFEVARLRQCAEDALAHPSGKPYTIYKDIPIAPLPKLFLQGCCRPKQVYSHDKSVVIGHFENGVIIPVTLDITQPAVQSWARREYWKGSIENNSIVWAHSNITTFFADYSLVLAHVLSFVGSCEFKGHCGTCGKKDLPFSATSRTAFAEKVNNVLERNTGICPECSAAKQVEQAKAAKAAAEQALIAQQQALAQKEQGLATYRQSLELKHGALMTGLICPECEDGFLIIRLNSTQMKPFSSCSRFNPHKYSCKYATSIAPEHHEEYLKLFEQRLTESMVTA